MSKIRRIPASKPWQGGTSQPKDYYIPGQTPTPPLNHRLSVAHSLCKRNGTDLIASLNISPSEYVTTLQGRFVVILGPSSIRVFDLKDREWKTVKSATGDYDYLSNANRENLSTAEFLDSLIVANTTRITEFETTPDYEIVGRAEFWKDLEDDAETGGAPVGEYAEVLTSEGEHPRGFYQKQLLDNGETLWRRVPPPNSPNGQPVPSTLPHQLQYQPATDEFIWEQAPWESRLSGNEDSNEAPSWANSTIDCIAVFASRLFIIGGGAITAGDRTVTPRNPYNFFFYDVENKAKIDRIDEFIDDASVGTPFHARGIGNALIILCDNGVGTFSSGGEILNAFNGQWQTVDKVGMRDVEPASAALELMAIDDQGLVRWYIWDRGIRARTPLNDHYQSLLDGRETPVGDGVSRLSISSSTLYILTDGDTFVWQGYPTDDGNIQSAWSRLRFNSKPIMVHQYSGRDYFICEDQIISYYNREPNIPTDVEHEVCLDAREHLEGAYDPIRDETVFQLKRDATENTRLYQVASPNGDKVSAEVKPHRFLGKRIFFSGDRSGKHYLGDLYETRADLPPASFGPVYAKKYWVGVDLGYRQSTDFKLEALIHGEEFEEEWTSADMGTVDTVGPLIPQEGEYRFVIRGDARDIDRISIVSHSAGYLEISWWSPRLQGGIRE